MRTTIDRVIQAAARLPWAITEEALDAVSEVLTRRANTEAATEEQIAAAIQARHGRGGGNGRQEGGVAVIPIHGVIAPKANQLTEFSGGATADRLQASFDAAMDDPNVRTVVLDIDSPGGQVQGVPELAAHMMDRRGEKRVVAVANHMAASAAYWLAVAADEVVAAPTAIVGSIGVYTVHTDASAADAKRGIKRTVLKAGEFKAEGNPYEPLSEDARDFMQDQLEQFYGMFVDGVARGRGVTPAAVREGFGKGRSVTAKDALALGMIDRIATLAEVLEDLGIDRRRASAAMSAAAESDVVEVEALEAYTDSNQPAVNIYIDADGTGEPAAITEGPPTTNAAPLAEEQTDMEGQSTSAQHGAAENGNQATATAGADRAVEHERTNALAELAEMHGLQAELPKWLRSGWSESRAKDHILSRVNEQLQMIQNPPGNDLTEKEKREYSVVRAIDAAASGDWRRAGFEREVSEHIGANLPDGYQPNGGFYMPTSLPTKAAAIDSATATAAAELVFTEEGSFIDLLRNRMKVRELGATYLAGLIGPVKFPKQSGAGTANWVGEKPGVDVPESNITTTTVDLDPKTVQATQATTKQLLRQTSRDVEQLLRNDLALIHALKVDLAAINGAGTGNEPEGVLNVTGIGDVAGGTNGAAPTYAHMVDLETEIAVDNADIATMAYLSTPGIRGTLKKTETFATGNGRPVWTGGMEGEVNGYAAHVSNQVPSNLTKGTGTNLHAIIFGVWSQLLIGEWGMLEILVDPYAQKKQGLIEITSFQMVGLAVRYPQAFAAMQDAIAS